MLACVDVQYEETRGNAACCLFNQWQDTETTIDLVEQVTHIEPYIPGQLYRRELPCLLGVLKKTPCSLEVVLVDGYVWLNDEHTPGLGAHLYHALGGDVAVIGVAKSCYRQAGAYRPLLRGESRRPLYISAVGISVDEAAECVASMHGSHRIPTLLKKVDQLSRRGGHGP